MAIQFARIEIVGRSSGGNACCRGAYNARAIVKDNKTNILTILNIKATTYTILYYFLSMQIKGLILLLNLRMK